MFNGFRLFKFVKIFLKQKIPAPHFIIRLASLSIFFTPPIKITWLGDDNRQFILHLLVKTPTKKKVFFLAILVPRKSGKS